MKPITAILTLALVGALVGWSWEAHQRGREAERADSLATVVLEERAAAAGWQTRLVESTQDLARRLQDTTQAAGVLRAEKAALAREVEALGAELRAVVDVEATASGQVEGEAMVHADSVSPGDHLDTTWPPDSITAPLDDGLLTGRVAYYPPRSLFDLEYSVRVGLALGIIETPDDRLLATARPTDPDRVSLSFGEVYYELPEPVRVCSVRQKATWLAIGAGAAEGVDLLRLIVAGG